MKIKPFRLLEMLLHSITVAALLLKSFDEIAKGLFFPGFIILGLAVTAMVITFFWKQLNMAPRIARLACYYLEAPAMLITSFIFHSEQNARLSQLFLIIAISGPVYGFLTSVKKRKGRAAVQKQR